MILYEVETNNEYIYREGNPSSFRENGAVVTLVGSDSVGPGSTPWSIAVIANKLRN